MNSVFLLGIIEKKKKNQYSQPYWFSGSQLDISKFSVFNSFFVYSPICMKFAPDSLVLEILSFWI